MILSSYVLVCYSRRAILSLLWPSEKKVINVCVCACVRACMRTCVRVYVQVFYA